jgi:hypothetical protein
MGLRTRYKSPQRYGRALFVTLPHNRHNSSKVEIHNVEIHDVEIHDVEIHDVEIHDVEIDVEI